MPTSPRRINPFLRKSPANSTVPYGSMWASTPTNLTEDFKRTVGADASVRPWEVIRIRLSVLRKKRDVSAGGQGRPPLQTSRESSAYFAGFQKRLAVGCKRDSLRCVLHLHPSRLADLVQLRLAFSFKIPRREKPDAPPVLRSCGWHGDRHVRQKLRRNSGLFPRLADSRLLGRLSGLQMPLRKRPPAADTNHQDRIIPKDDCSRGVRCPVKLFGYKPQNLSGQFLAVFLRHSQHVHVRMLFGSRS